MTPMTTNDGAMMLTCAGFAALLDGCQYREEGSRDLFARMKTAGCVAVFGASDDLMEFRGAINDEIGAFNGTTAHVTPSGLPQNECADEDCPYHARQLEVAAEIHAHWDCEGYSWTFATEIPHATFDIFEDGNKYCRGIVFALADATRAAPSTEDQKGDV